VSLLRNAVLICRRGHHVHVSAARGKKTKWQEEYYREARAFRQQEDTSSPRRHECSRPMPPQRPDIIPRGTLSPCLAMKNARFE